MSQFMSQQIDIFFQDLQVTTVLSELPSAFPGNWIQLNALALKPVDQIQISQETFFVVPQLLWCGKDF